MRVFLAGINKVFLPGQLRLLRKNYFSSLYLGGGGKTYILCQISLCMTRDVDILVTDNNLRQNQINRKNIQIKVAQ